MSYVNPDPDPRLSTGLEPGGGVPPGETPPAESSMPEAGPQDLLSNPAKGWAKGPMALILGVQQRQVVRAGVGQLGDPARVPLHHRLEGLAGGAAVAEGGTLGDLREVLRQRLGRALRQPVLVLVGLLLHDPQQLPGAVVAEGDGA